jgi:organic radical activating enzyme
MIFVRFAGCSVGKLEYPHICTTWAAHQFICDTDYAVRTHMTAAEIVDVVLRRPAAYVCITGGEPLLHDIGPLVEALQQQHKKVHLETSGTIETKIPFDWISVSPKAKYLPSMVHRADELKLLITDETITQHVVNTWEDMQERVFLQPANQIYTVNHHLVHKCLDILERLPFARLSIQLHKLVGEP